VASNSSFAFCRYLLKQGVFSYLDFFFVARLYTAFTLGKISLHVLHERSFDRLFFGKQAALFEKHIDLFLDKWLQKALYIPTIDYLRYYKSRRQPIAVFSNSPIFLVHAICKRLGIKHAFGSHYDIDKQGNFCAITQVMDGELKAKYFLEFADNHMATERIAFSDQLQDLPFLQAATVAIVVQGKGKLKKIAKRAGWQLI